MSLTEASFCSPLEAELTKEASLHGISGQAGGEEAADMGLGRDAERRAPSLSISHNCTEEKREKWNVLTGSHRRTAEAVAVEIQSLAKEFGIETLAFWTGTFANETGFKAPSMPTMQKRWRSLRAHVIATRYKRGVCVSEKGGQFGRWHKHGVFAVGFDVRTGFDWEAQGEVCRIQDACYRAGQGDAYKRDKAWQQASARRNASATPQLRCEWAFWRKTAPLYGFGRTELLPVRSTAEGIARYVGSYIGKQVRERDESEKWARLVQFINYAGKNPEGDRVSLRKASSRFCWNSDRGWLWRRKVEAWARIMGCLSMEELDALLRPIAGARWAWHFQADILASRVDGRVLHPSLEAAHESVDLWFEHETRIAEAMDRWERQHGHRLAGTIILQPMEAKR